MTVRKLEFEADAFAFGDKLVAKWFPEKSDADKKGVMIIVTTGKDGAITGGPSFTQVPQASKHEYMQCHNTYYASLSVAMQSRVKSTGFATQSVLLC